MQFLKMSKPLAFLPRANAHHAIIKTYWTYSPETPLAKLNLDPFTIARDRCGGEIPRNGRTRDRQQQDEGLF